MLCQTDEQALFLSSHCMLLTLPILALRRKYERKKKTISSTGTLNNQNPSLYVHNISSSLDFLKVASSSLLNEPRTRALAPSLEL